MLARQDGSGEGADPLQQLVPPGSPGAQGPPFKPPMPSVWPFQRGGPSLHVSLGGGPREPLWGLGTWSPLQKPAGDFQSPPLRAPHPVLGLGETEANPQLEAEVEGCSSVQAQPHWRILSGSPTSHQPACHQEAIQDVEQGLQFCKRRGPGFPFPHVDTHPQEWGTREQPASGGGWGQHSDGCTQETDGWGRCAASSAGQL